jgi:hypothetical protein
MAIQSVRCPALGAPVARITDLEGGVIRVVCGEYNDRDGTCRLKASARASGPLGQLLERVSEHSLDTRSIRCVLLTA